jgi:hypothetical protein
MKNFFTFFVIITNFIQAIISYNEGLILTTKLLKSLGYKKNSKIFNLKDYDIEAIAPDAFLYFINAEKVKIISLRFIIS